LNGTSICFSAPAVGVEHDAGSREHRANAGLGGRRRFRFPRDAGSGEEVGARRAFFGEDFVAAVSVVADRRTRHEHARLALATRDGGREHGRAAHATVADAALLLAGPSVLADALTREVHDRVEPFERRRVDTTGFGVPADRVTRGDTAAFKPEHRWPSARNDFDSALPISPLAP